MTHSKPQISHVESQIIVGSHSPVLLGAHDSLGNYTGIRSDGNKDLPIKQEIPGSSYVEFGDSQYIFLPKKGIYTFSYQGIGNGSTTIEIETFANDVRSPVVSYTDMPTTVNTKATFEVDTSSLGSTQIALDQNGDEVIDGVIKADGTELSLSELIALLKTTINRLNITSLAKKSLLSKVVLLEQLITIKNEKLRIFSVNLNINVIKLEVELLKKSKKLSQQDAMKLIDLLNKIKEQI